VAAEPIPQYHVDLPLLRQTRLEPDHGHGGRRHRASQDAASGRSREAVLPPLRPGGTHAPHHPTPEWIKKISDMHLFDKGWNELREQIFANQRKLGVIPPHAKLTPWPDELKQWDQLTADEKKMFIRQANVYAASLAYTDHEIGRVIQAVEDIGKLDNTLIIYISGDNGSSAEGSPIGTPNEVASFNGMMVPVEDQLKYFYDVWGSDQTYPHMAVAWTWAFDTPFKWTKQVASHFGGTRQGGVRLEVRRAGFCHVGIQQQERHWSWRHRSAQGRRVPCSHPDDGANAATRAAVGRDLRCRRRYRYPGRRQGLQGAISIQRQTE
jgi:hypothetical protein